MVVDVTGKLAYGPRCQLVAGVGFGGVFSTPMDGGSLIGEIKVDLITSNVYQLLKNNILVSLATFLGFV